MTQSVDIHALAGAYALDALDDIERAGFARHLARCEACTLEVAELRETAARLADLTWEAPPPAMESDVLAEVRRTRQVGPGKKDRETGTAINWRRWTAGAVAAGILAIGAATTTYVVQEQRVERAERIQAVLSAPDVVTRKVAVDGGGEVTVVTSPSRNAAVAVLTGLSKPDESHAYQLWLLVADTPQSAGVMAAGRGTGLQLVDGVTDAAALAVTLEPAAGSQEPTLPLVASVTL